VKPSVKTSYTVYSIVVFVVWVVLLIVASAVDEPHKRNDIFLVFFGFVIGWASATIARYVYAPPKKYQTPTGDET
jgi:hypothetical protein